MSNLICPDCGSDNIITERRPDGFHICRKCSFYWRNNEALKQTVFDQITQSPETLAEELITSTYDEFKDCTVYWAWRWNGRREAYYTKPEAIAATVAKLKEVCDE